MDGFFDEFEYALRDTSEEDEIDALLADEAPEVLRFSAAFNKRRGKLNAVVQRYVG